MAPRLTKAVLGVASDDAFQWTQNAAFHTKLIVSVCKANITLTKGKTFDLPDLSIFENDFEFKPEFLKDIQVLECCPTKQGVLSVNTEIIIVKNKVKESEKQNVDFVDFNDRVNEYVPSVNAFTMFYKAERQEVVLNTVSEFNATAAPLQDLGIESVSTNTEWEKMFVESLNNDFDDLQNIGVTSETMANCALYDGELVHVKCVNDVDNPNDTIAGDTVVEPTDGGVDDFERRKELYGDEETCKLSSLPKEGPVNMHEILELSKIWRTARICLIKPNAVYKKNVAYMTPCFKFNLTRNNKPMKDSIIRIKKITTDVTGSLGNKWAKVVPYASQFTLSIIHSPNYSPLTSYNNVIKKYFSIPRLLKCGDVLTLSLKDDPKCMLEAVDGRYNPDIVVHMKVLEITGPSGNKDGEYMADFDHTDACQTGSVHDYIPVAMETWYRSRIQKVHKVMALNPYKTTIDILTRTIAPHTVNRKCKKSTILPLLLVGSEGSGKNLVCKTVAAKLNLHFYTVNCYDLCGDTPASTEARIKGMFAQVGMFSPCVVVLRNIHALGKDRDGVGEDSRVASYFHEIMKTPISSVSMATPQNYPVVVIATTSKPKLLTADMQEGFLHEVTIATPSERDRREIMGVLIDGEPCASDVSKHHIAQRTAGMVLGDLLALISHTKRAVYNRLKNTCGVSGVLSLEEEKSLVEAGILVLQEDFNTALDQLQAAHSDAIGAPKIPNVTWEDVGGLADVKQEILDTIQLPLNHPELLAAGLRRSGVLLYGPPGSGKTLLAKAVATECSLNFLSVKGPELINMYVGQSEENVREVFNRARSATPCVIFFDELDSLAPNRGRSGDSGGVMDRVVSQLLAELDGLHKACDVFVIGATNRPDLLDPALLRPGRFDKLLYLGVSQDTKSQLNILQALTRKFKMSPDMDLEQVAVKCPQNLTGADFYAMCSDAMLAAIKRKIVDIEQGNSADNDVIVTPEDFNTALEQLVPSVSEEELEHYKQLQSSIGQG